MSKLTVDDLVQVQQRNEELLKQIAESLAPKKRNEFQGILFELAGVLSIIAWVFGAWVASKGNLIGVCICMIAVSARLERRLGK